MRKLYAPESWPFIPALLLLLAIASCKKDNKNTNVQSQAVAIATPTTLGLYETDTSIYKVLLIAVSKIGNSAVDYGLVFDTGSGGMVIDASGIVPASMVTTSGFNFTGDSVIVNGITITSQTTMLEYGVDDSTLTKVYGNLAYAPVTIGDENGNITIKRLPFFMYYKAVDQDGNPLDAHYFDTFGVSEEYITFPNNSYATSPFSYFDPGAGLTKGFKLAALGGSNFSYDGTYVPGLVTLGLTSTDLSSSSGFTMNTMSYYADEGYNPILPATITYGNRTVSTDVLFDTGTAGESYIEDPRASGLSLLPQNTQVTIATNSGFTDTFATSAADNLTFIENPNTTGAEFSDFSIEFFLTNEYMMDFTNHRLGLKNN